MLQLAGAILFVLAGLCFVMKPSIFRYPGHPAPIQAIGIVSMLFFGLCGLYILKKLTDNTPGLVINDEGIIDNSSGVSAGLVLWTDIREIKIATVFNNKILMLIVKNPEQYISRQKSLIKRKAMQINYKTCGSPLSISATTLTCSFSFLYETIQKKFRDSET